MKFLTYLILLLPVFLLIPQHASAHAGGGPPFVLINNKYAQTSSLFLGAPTENGLNVPQDTAPDNYVVNTPISFSIDTKQLSIDPSVIDDLIFKWSITTGSNFTEVVGDELRGTSVKTQFSKAGSYLVTLMSNPSGNDFVIIDTILIQVLPTANYKIPTTTIAVASGGKSGTKTTFTATSNFKDPAYYWDFSENKTEEGTSVSKVFEQLYFYTPLIVRTAGDGFVTDTGLIIVGDKGEISFSLIDPNTDPKTLNVKKSAFSTQTIITILIVATIIAISGILLLIHRRKK